MTETITIPDSFREALGELKRWNGMLTLLENLQACSPDIFDEQVQSEWDAFRDMLSTDCATAAEMLINALVCICLHRPEMFDLLIEDALDPLSCLDVQSADEVLAWCDGRDAMDAGIRQWLHDTLPGKIICLDDEAA
jgi:hypothetical protein